MTMSAYRGKGHVSMALYADGASYEARPLKRIGNVSNLVFSFTEEEAKLNDYRSAGGGIDASIKRVSDFTGTITVRHFKDENFARLLWGTTTAKNATAITGESGYKIVPDTFIPTARIIDTSVAPVVKKGVTVVSTNDYTVSAGGILIASTISTGGVASGDSITIDYTPKLSHWVQALISSAPDVSICFEGVNEVDSKYMIVKFWKAKLGTAQNVSLIGDDFGSLEVSFTVESDATIVAAGISKYAQIEIQD